MPTRKAIFKENNVSLTKNRVCIIFNLTTEEFFFISTCFSTFYSEESLKVVCKKYTWYQASVKYVKS